MNLKYYLRGLGIGIVVTTLIVGIAAGNRTETLSDAEVRQRAEELGMVEASGVLADDVPSAEDVAQEEMQQEPDNNHESTAAPEKEGEPRAAESAPAPTAEPTSVPEATEEPVKEAEPTPEPVKETPVPVAENAREENVSTQEESKESPKPEAVIQKQETEETSGKTVVVTVKSGDGSYSVCKKLEEAGLIESAAAYDTYLYERGYDKRIIAAAHEIPVDADEEQIAKIITGKN